MRPRNPVTTFIAAMVVTLASFAPRESAAEPNDGLYGRFEGDLDLAIGLGAALQADGLSGGAVARALYLETAGVYATYTDALGANRDASRSLALGIALRPVFLPRWGLDLERGPAFLDLAVDSFTVDLGTFWADTPHAALRAPGLELAAGFELPLLGRAAGPWLGVRASKRWSTFELGGAEAPADSHGEMGMLILSWHALIGAHVVDAGDHSPH